LSEEQVITGLTVETAAAGAPVRARCRKVGRVDQRGVGNGASLLTVRLWAEAPLAPSDRQSNQITASRLAVLNRRETSQATRCYQPLRQLGRRGDRGRPQSRLIAEEVVQPLAGGS
jgi:hypothetical protein